MFDRFGFRWIAASVVTLLHVALLGITLSSETHVHGPMAATPSTVYRRAAFQEAQTVAFPAERKTSGILKADLVLNLPALLLGGIVVGLLQWHGDPALMAVSTVFVALIWFRIGRSIDEQRARIPPGSRSATKFGLAKRLILRTAALLFLIVALSGFTPVYHHRTGETDSLFGIIILWCAPYLVFSFWGQRRPKGRPLEPA